MNAKIGILNELSNILTKKEKSGVSLRIIQVSKKINHNFHVSQK